MGSRPGAWHRNRWGRSPPAWRGNVCAPCALGRRAGVGSHFVPPTRRQRVQQRLRGLEARLRIRLKAEKQRLVERLGHRRRRDGWERGRRRVRGLGARMLARQQMIEDRSRPVDVARRVQQPLRSPIVLGRRTGNGVGGAAQPQVHDLDDPRCHHDVGRLDRPVDEPARVAPGPGHCARIAEAQDLAEGEPVSRRDGLGEVAPVDELAHHVALTARGRRARGRAPGSGGGPAPRP